MHLCIRQEDGVWRVVERPGWSVEAGWGVQRRWGCVHVPYKTEDKLWSSHGPSVCMDLEVELK